MQYRLRASRIFAALCVAMMLWQLPGTSAAADQSYLNALEQEADTIDMTAPADTPSPGTPQPSSQLPTNTPKETLSKGMSKAEFETELQQNFFGSYLFYSKLSDQGKENVYQEYLKRDDVAYLREVIKQELTK